MRIILANKFYYPRGGDCIYMIGLEDLLKKNGHEVAIFSQKYEENLDHKYKDFWPSKVDYSTRNIRNLGESLLRPIYSKEVKQKFKKILNNFKPDIVHLNNIHSQISPVIAQICYNKNIPVIWTLHDYKLLCPSYSCTRNGKPCELCFENKINVIKHKCVKNIVGSTIAFAEAKKWNRDKLEMYTSNFIAPSEFMKRKMVEGGYSSKKIKVINNFIDDFKINEKVTNKEDYYLYFGRFSKEKGVETLLKAASKLDFKLKLAGTGPLLNEYKRKYQNNNIEFLGFKHWDDLKIILQKAQFFIIPSEWYENNPLTIIESYALGTPVLGANIGGIPELIEDHKTGLIFESGNETDISNKIKYFYENLNSKDLGQYSIQVSKERFKSSNYYKKIIDVYNSVL